MTQGSGRGRWVGVAGVVEVACEGDGDPCVGAWGALGALEGADPGLELELDRPILLLRLRKVNLELKEEIVKICFKEKLKIF